MPDPRSKIIKNDANRPCEICGGIHEFISALSKDVRNDCSVPVAFSDTKARAVALAYGMNANEVVVGIPDNTIVIMDDSARKLPRTSPVVLVQGAVTEDVMPPAGTVVRR